MKALPLREALNIPFEWALVEIEALPNG